MAKANQTATKSTGGTAPRKQLGPKAARLAKNCTGGAPGEMRDWAILAIEFQRRPRVKNGRCVAHCEGGYALNATTKEEAIALFGVLPEVATFARSNPALKITHKLAAYWGFLDGHEDGEEGEWGKDWGITHIKFAPGLGLDEDELKGGFVAKAGARGEVAPIQLRTLAFPGESEDDRDKCKIT